MGAIVFGLRASHVGLVVPNDYIPQYVATDPQKLIGFAFYPSYETNEIPGRSGLPLIPVDKIQTIVERDSLSLLRFE